MIYRVKGFGIVNETEIDVFLELPCFLYDRVNVGHSISGSSAFSKSFFYIGSSQFTYCWSIAWRILSMTLLAWEMSATVWWFEHSLALPFLGIGMRIDLFQSCGHCWVFQIWWHNEYKTLTASSFRDLDSSAGISLHPLDLLATVFLRPTWLPTPKCLALGDQAYHHSNPVH